MEIEKLLPCPNPWCDCPSELAVEPIVGTGAYGVECGCGFNGPALGTPELAIAAWNTRAPAELTGWQPIETAEKNSRARLVWVPERESTFCVTWRYGRDEPLYPEGWVIFGGEWREFLQRATHWQPLPAPPGTTRAPADLRSALEAGSFLLDRLDDHENRINSEEDAREWHGHVAPAIARFRAALAPTKGDVS